MSDMFRYEREQWALGRLRLAGIDEVGRGPLAGPVVAAAAMFPIDADAPPVDDSKKLTDKRRREIRGELLAMKGFVHAIAEVDVATIDRINILEATRLAMRLAVEKLTSIDFALIDGLPVPDFPVENLAIVKGDGKSASVAAASVLAKIHRDDLMERYADQFPGYGFERNKGYGTKDHLEALEQRGACPIHRRSFAPVRKALGLDPVQPELF